MANRDSDALAMLYGHTRPRLMAVLVRLLQRRELAEEVLQDVYLRVWDRAGGREVLEPDGLKAPDVHATEDSATLADISAIRRVLCAKLHLAAIVIGKRCPSTG